MKRPTPTDSHRAETTPARRLILLFGYWPPTDIGIETRHGILWPFSKRQRYVDRNGNPTNYDVLAISPTFERRIGWKDSGLTIPHWGKGSGVCPVDYRQTSEDFWRIVRDPLNAPIAIMSFSRGHWDDRWILEENPRNLKAPVTPCAAPAEHWVTRVGFYDDSGNKTEEPWLPPFIGGSAEDPSPGKWRGGIDGDPPDNSQAALTVRRSSLPMAEIVAAVNRLGTVRAIINSSTAVGTVGSFVSEFMAYHVSWYKEWMNDASICQCAGHTHVGGQVRAEDGEVAVRAQLDALIATLP